MGQGASPRVPRGPVRDDPPAFRARPSRPAARPAGQAAPRVPRTPPAREAPWPRSRTRRPAATRPRRSRRRPAARPSALPRRPRAEAPGPAAGPPQRGVERVHQDVDQVVTERGVREDLSFQSGEQQVDRRVVRGIELRRTEGIEDRAEVLGAAAASRAIGCESTKPPGESSAPRCCGPAPRPPRQPAPRPRTGSSSCASSRARTS